MAICIPCARPFDAAQVVIADIHVRVEASGPGCVDRLHPFALGIVIGSLTVCSVDAARNVTEQVRGATAAAFIRKRVDLVALGVYWDADSDFNVQLGGDVHAQMRALLAGPRSYLLHPASGSVSLVINDVGAPPPGELHALLREPFERGWKEMFQQAMPACLDPHVIGVLWAACAILARMSCSAVLCNDFVVDAACPRPRRSRDGGPGKGRCRPARARVQQVYERHAGFLH